MADLSTTPPLTPASVRAAHDKIKPYIHRTPLLSSRSINAIASSSNGPQFNIYFKCENMQRIGAFKARGAFHAVLHLIEELGIDEMRRRGVVTHSSGNHAQALALAAKEFDIPAHIVMPSISTPSKIAGTKAYTDKVYFSGSTSVEREAVVKEVMEKTGSILVPPYDHPDIMLGQGTAAMEMDGERRLNAVLTPCGGGGLLSGTAVYYSDKSTLVFGCEPSYQGANDAERGLREGQRVESVKTLTIADGLRTPLGVNPWGILTGKADKGKLVEGVYSVSEDEIKEAMRLICERLKVFVEPSAAVPLAVVLSNQEFRRWVAGRQGGKVWDIGIVLSGGNTTIEAIVGMFGEAKGEKEMRAEGKVGLDGRAEAENIAG